MSSETLRKKKTRVLILISIFIGSIIYDAINTLAISRLIGRGLTTDISNLFYAYAVDNGLTFSYIFPKILFYISLILLVSELIITYANSKKIENHNEKK